MKDLSKYRYKYCIQISPWDMEKGASKSNRLIYSFSKIGEDTHKTAGRTAVRFHAALTLIHLWLCNKNVTAWGTFNGAVGKLFLVSYTSLSNCHVILKVIHKTDNSVANKSIIAKSNSLAPSKTVVVFTKMAVLPCCASRSEGSCLFILLDR